MTSSPSSKEIKAPRHLKKQTIKPIPPPQRLTSKDLFGEDSADEVDENQSSSNGGKDVTPLYSIFVNKLGIGLSKQVLPDKTGTHYS